MFLVSWWGGWWKEAANDGGVSVLNLKSLGSLPPLWLQVLLDVSEVGAPRLLWDRQAQLRALAMRLLGGRGLRTPLPCRHWHRLP